MKKKIIVEKNDQELNIELEKMKKELKELRYKKVTGVIDNPLKIRTLRRAVARINGILHLREIERIKKEIEKMGVEK